MTLPLLYVPARSRRQGVSLLVLMATHMTTSAHRQMSMPKRAARISISGLMTQVNRTNELMTVCRSSAGVPAVGAARPDDRRDAAVAAGRASLVQSLAPVVPGCGSQVSD